MTALAAAFGYHLQWFGTLVALGLVVGRLLVSRATRVYGDGNVEHAVAAYTWCVVGGIVGAHLLDVLAYQPELLRTEGPRVLLRVWQGSASLGGAVVGFGSFVLYFRIQKLRIEDYLDALALGIAPGWAVCRLGCAVAHDHPGVHSTAWFAVRFPDGLRLDMGMLDAVVLVLLSAGMWLLARRKRPQGALMGVFMLGYSVARFLLDFLRATDLPGSDRRILGLTPAQWICPLLAAGGLWFLRHGLGGSPLRRELAPPTAPPPQLAPPSS